ncbi:hypothetical protein MXD81_42435, partial [Microbacteriaceae bacterium K1510]|nr:hypothetical protein [Microbacteriaceae bacterium K1510]
LPRAPLLIAIVPPGTPLVAEARRPPVLAKPRRLSLSVRTATAFGTPLAMTTRRALVIPPRRAPIIIALPRAPLLIAIVPPGTPLVAEARRPPILAKPRRLSLSVRAATALGVPLAMTARRALVALSRRAPIVVPRTRPAAAEARRAARPALLMTGPRLAPSATRLPGTAFTAFHRQFFLIRIVSNRPTSRGPSATTACRHAA